MNLMQAQRQAHLKYPRSTQLLKSSDDLGWPGLVAELRSHGSYEGPGAVGPADAEVAIVVRGCDEGLLAFKSAESWQSARPTTGSIRLRPAGRTCDEVRISVADVNVLHLYVPMDGASPRIGAGLKRLGTRELSEAVVDANCTLAPVRKYVPACDALSASSPIHPCAPVAPSLALMTSPSSAGKPER